jgi:hypothetical protein
MDCKQFEKKIPDFLADRLTGKETEAFLAHFDSCADCHEELSIQYLVQAGLPRLETGDTFNLKTELAEEISTARKRIRKRRSLAITAYTLEILTFAACAAIAFLIMTFLK